MRKLLILSIAAWLLVGCGQPAASASVVPDADATASNAVASPAAPVVPVTVKDFALDPKDVSKQGQVNLDVTNEGPTIHNVTIRDDGGKVLAATMDLKAGESEVLTADLAAGSYILYCSLPGHESLGIKGTLVVQP
jgi:plastocyanin